MSDNDENPQEITPSESVSQVSYCSSTTFSAPQKNKSKIWPQFEVVSCDGDKQKPVKAKCIYSNCCREFYCKDGSTGCMGKHLKRDHGFDDSYNPPDGLIQSHLRRDSFGSNGNVVVTVRIIFIVII